jgi:hypothetical protein
MLLSGNGADDFAGRLLSALDQQFPGYARWYELTGKAPDERLTPQEQEECDGLAVVGAAAGQFAQDVNMALRARRRTMEKGGAIGDLPLDIQTFLAKTAV